MDLKIINENNLGAVGKRQDKMVLLTRGGHRSECKAQFSITDFLTGQKHAFRGFRLIYYTTSWHPPVMGGLPQNGPPKCNRPP